MKKWFRVATEGATTDGRAISRAWIEQMAKNFNPQKYGARVWLEHMRGMFADGPFKALGDVHALRAEENADGKMELFAQIEPTNDLVSMNKERQKIYTSIEVDPEFSDTGEAYLVGLAVTDSPASLGTEMLQFSATAKSNPLNDRKQRPENLFTAALETELDFTEETESESGNESDEPSLFNKVKALFTKHREAGAAKFADFKKDLESTLGLFVSEAQELRGELEKTQGNYTQLKKDHEALEQQFNELKTKLEKSPHNHSQRPPATGGENAILTDC
ncbi:capsid scaffolding serine peptidase GPO [Marinobacter sp. 3-2]|jgi:NTP pyrophosphatase (non-canonical NTP hydrolase)|uniref:GPO family capsid scaffolding protein n=1 Tax=Marinobacter sp. 3-2 TaxID=2485141 RepID=UPI000D39DCEB|nr:GPO family capsid scaffolding protein [Marinobacter sp. 3-2]ROQ39317.1 capsid scaffolding serine peptidase GPO [Marinobacter sp. 3-2]